MLEYTIKNSYSSFLYNLAYFVFLVYNGFVKKIIEVKMATDNIGDSVGKKIVEALKIQDNSEDDLNFSSENVEEQKESENTNFFSSVKGEAVADINSGNIDSIFQHNLNQSIAPKMGLFTVSNDVELPENVAVLNKLIAKLPVGVSRQTGATIIRQTMEALGISMQSVMQEAKQVQESLTHRAAECQQNIIDYKKQISNLELQSLQFQRQAVVMNDIINLFINSGNI